MSFETNFNGVKTNVTDFQKIFTFTATGLKPNTYYDVICENENRNHCATQSISDNPYPPGSGGHGYSKNLKRIKNIEIPTNIDLKAAGLYSETKNIFGTNYDSQAELPLKSTVEGKLTFKFDGNAWIQHGGKASTTTSGSGITIPSNWTLSEESIPVMGALHTGAFAPESVWSANVLYQGARYYIRAWHSTSAQYSNFKPNVDLSSEYVYIRLIPPKGTSPYVVGVGSSAIPGQGPTSVGNQVTGVKNKKTGEIQIFSIGGLQPSFIPPDKRKLAKVGSYSISAPVTSMSITLNESQYIDPILPNPPIPVPPIPPIPISPPDPPIGWSTTKPDVPANTVTQKTLSSNTVTTSKELGILKTSKQFGTGGQVPLSEVSLYFDYAQTFYLDPALLDNSQYVTITGVNLYFKDRPHHKNNQSGLINPGVYLFISEVENGIPNLRKAYRESIIRKDFNEISPSLDASDSTEFSFKSPMPLKTGKSYAIVINFEDPQYSLWTATQGVKLIGSNQICDGAYNGGKLFRASNYLEIDNDPKTQDEVLKPIPATDLMFDILGLELTDTTANLELVNDDYEFIEINNPYSVLVGFSNIFDTFGNRQYIYQDFGNVAANVFYHKPGTLTINKPQLDQFKRPSLAPVATFDEFTYHSRDVIITGQNTQFSKELSMGSMIILTDSIASDTNGYVSNTCIRKVIKVINNTTIIINDPCTFATTTGYYKVSPIAEMETAFQNPDLLILNKSKVDEDIFFVANAINYINFTGGSGYTNSDYITFSGGIKNGKASLTTNSTGGIVSINITNTGYGFITSQITGTITTSTGSGASITAITGGQIKGELYGAKADVVKISSFPIHNFIPNLDFNIKGGTVTDTKINFSFKNEITNTYNLADGNLIPVTSGESVDVVAYDGEVLSKSLEILNTKTLGSSTSEGKSSLISFILKSDNKYDTPELHEELTSIYVFNNEINNDATDEHTNFGNAVARHISKKITFDKDRFAEDIRVIATAYRPKGTDIKIYAKLHNSKDEEAFDDKDWSELEITDATFGGREYSSKANRKDYVELTYGLKAYPDFTDILTGDAFVYSASGNTTVTGIGTSFNTDLANGDVIVLYDEQFPNTTYAVAVVANTPVATSFEINRSFSNLSLEDATLKIGKCNKPKMAFNDIHTDNVATYYSMSLNEYTTYDTFSIKIVMLSDSAFIIPRVNDIRAIGVSA